MSSPPEGRVLVLGLAPQDQELLSEVTSFVHHANVLAGVFRTGYKYDLEKRELFLSYQGTSSRPKYHTHVTSNFQQLHQFYGFEPTEITVEFHVVAPTKKEPFNA